MPAFYTIGHSSHAPEHFLGLLRRHGVEVLVDTRSAPYSRYSPQFDREALRQWVAAAGVKYLFLGDVVGGRPRDEACYDGQGHVLYGRVARQPEFREAIERLERGADEFRVALLCSEEDPAHCHRRLLIGRVLQGAGAEIRHIRGDGALETEAEVEARSGKALVEAQPALFGEIEEDGWRSTGVSPRLGLVKGMASAVPLQSESGYHAPKTHDSLLPRVSSPYPRLRWTSSKSARLG